MSQEIMNEHEIRARYDEHAIVVYQAYRRDIAIPAIQQQQFVSPFSLNRMTWIKPSFLWMMERSNWGLKKDQEYILAIHLTRQGWEEALSAAMLTSFDAKVYRDYDDWRQRFKQATVHVQWDPERTLRGAHLPQRSIQVGISRHLIARYVAEWILRIEDITPLTRKLYALIQSGHADKAKELLPRERVYPLPSAIARRLGMQD